MTFEEARRVLGMEPDEAPGARLEEFEAARERIAELVRQAPNDVIAIRYQEGLQEFDRALAALREELERRRVEKVSAMMALVPGAVSGRTEVTKRPGFLDEPMPPRRPPRVAPTPMAAAAAGSGETPEARPGTPVKPALAGRRKGSRLRHALHGVLALMIAVPGGGWLYFHIEAEREVERRTEMAFLETLGAKLIEGRRWQEARQAYERIEALDPDSKVAAYGVRSIEFGMREEQEQFVGYWSGEARAAFEAGRFDDAGDAVEKVLERYPAEKEVLALRVRIDSARKVQVREGWAEKVRSAVEARDWAAADEALAGLGADLPEDDMLRVLGREVEQAREKQRREHERARELADAARLRDRGTFDPQVMEWLREAIALAPDDAGIQSLYEKVASYSRTLRVPQDVPTLAEALAKARDRDRVVLGEGSFAAGLVVQAAVQIEGAGEDKTVLENAAEEAPVLTFGPKAKGATVSGLVFRKTGFDPGGSRYPAVQLRGAEVAFSDCLFEAASGHGLEVMEGGLGEMLRCRFKGNGWDGAAARGAGSRLVVRESLAEGNFGHGFEVWDGARMTLRDCVSKRNSRAGVLVDSVVEGIEISGNEIFGNREYGVVLAAGSSGGVRGNSCHSNLQGGMVVRFPAMSMLVEKNKLEKNEGPGLILEQGLREDIYQGNVVRGNDGGELVSGARFESGE